MVRLTKILVHIMVWCRTYGRLYKDISMLCLHYRETQLSCVHMGAHTAISCQRPTPIWCHRRSSRWKCWLSLSSWICFWSYHYLYVEFVLHLAYSIHALIHVLTRAALNAEIPSPVKISIRTEGVGRYMRFIIDSSIMGCTQWTINFMTIHHYSCW